MKSRYALLWLCLAALATFAMASSSPQCARTSDQVLAPGLESLNTPDPVKVCQRDCDAAARTDTRIERKRHREALQTCNGDPVCAAEEDAMHQSILAEIEGDLLACRTACEHQQGSGTGGQ